MRFSGYIEQFLRTQSMRVLEKIVQLSCSHLLQTEHFIHPPFFFVCYGVVFVTFFTTVTAIIFLRITRVLIVKHFLEIILHVFCFLFLPLDYWRTSENRRLLVEGTISWEFWLAFLSVKLGWVLMDGWMQEWRRAIFMGYVIHNMCK